MGSKTMGRPAITLGDLPKDWRNKMLDLAREGASIVELSVELGISRDTFYALSKREEEFSDTVKVCKSLSESWWERQGRTQLQNKDFSYVGWYMNMKNRYGWKDRHDFTSKDKPLPIMGGVSVVQANESISEDSPVSQEDQGDTGGDSGGQDDSDPSVPD